MTGREASQHLGPTATRMERDGKASERGKENRQSERRREQRRQTLSTLHQELATVGQEVDAEESRLLAVRLAEIERPTVGLWQATRGREAATEKARDTGQKPPGMTFVFAPLAALAPRPQARPTNQPARPLAPAEEPEKPENESRLARIMREREARKKREREEERQPGRSLAEDWLDGMHKKNDGPP